MEITPAVSLLIALVLLPIAYFLFFHCITLPVTRWIEHNVTSPRLRAFLIRPRGFATAATAQMHRQHRPEWFRSDGAPRREAAPPTDD